VRPTSERARQAFFNIVAPQIAGAQFLDLFAGSGIFSFEAVSRGAAAATAIDSSRRNCETILRLAKEWDAPVTAIAGDVFATLQRLGGTPFRVVYADPPYDFARYDELLAAIGGQLSIPQGSLVAIEHRRNREPFTSAPARLRFKRRAEYGEIWISFFEPASLPQPLQ
jgi:16S rRNA (guanine966-N2)-methyltransferase